MTAAAEAAAQQRTTVLSMITASSLMVLMLGVGVAEARDSRLTLFVGGSVDDLHGQRDVTDALASRVLHVGEAGSRCLVKLLVNLLWLGQTLAGAEVLALAARAGLDPERVRSAASHSAGASRFMDRERFQ